MLRVLSDSRAHLTLFAIPDETNLKLLQDKHPDCPENRQTSPSIDNEADTLTVTSDLVKDMINSFPNGSGAGPSSLCAQHLKDRNGETGRKLLDYITELCNIFLSNEISVSVQPLLFGANLISLEKKCGGSYHQKLAPMIEPMKL